MGNVLNLRSERAIRQAQNLAKRLQEECGNEDMSVVACAVMALVRTLPQDLQAQICGAVTMALTQELKELTPNGNDDPKSPA